MRSCVVATLSLSGICNTQPTKSCFGIFPSGSLSRNTNCFFTAGGLSPSAVFGCTARFISSITRRKIAGEMSFFFKISATLLTSIFGMVFFAMEGHEWTRMKGNVKVAGAEEWFDVVNERDEVVGRATRREVHATGLWHRAVHVLVFDSAGRVFLQKRSMLKDLSPGLWDSSCSGHLEAGEDYDTAAVRELAEEIGVRLGSGNAPARWFRLEA